MGREEGEHHMACLSLQSDFHLGIYPDFYLFTYHCNLICAAICILNSCSKIYCHDLQSQFSVNKKAYNTLYLAKDVI